MRGLLDPVLVSILVAIAGFGCREETTAAPPPPPPPQQPLPPQQPFPPQQQLPQQPPPLPIPPQAPPQAMATPWLMLDVPSVAGWQPIEAQDHGPDRGYAYGYRHPTGITVSIFVYNRGLGYIRRDQGVLQSELQESISGVHQARQLGRYQSAREVERGFVSLGNVPNAPLAALGRLMVAQNSPERPSSIYITTHRGFFYKLRVSYNSDPLPQSEQLIQSLLAVLAATIHE